MSETPQTEALSMREYRSLTDRLDGPIEDVSIGVSALLSKIIRQSIRQGIQKLDEGLGENVREKIDEDLRRRGPQLEESARETARAELNEHLEKLRRQAKESGARIAAQIDSLDEAIRTERENRQRVQTETDEILRKLHDALSAARSESDTRIQQTRGELVQHLEKARGELQDLRTHGEKTLADASKRLEGHVETKAAAHAAELKAAHDRLVAMQRTGEEQRRVIELQQQALADMDRVLKQLRSDHDAHAPRVEALEAKVFKPGFFGRIGSLFKGKKSEEE